MTWHFIQWWLYGDNNEPGRKDAENMRGHLPVSDWLAGDIPEARHALARDCAVRKLGSRWTA
jgi:hypothetical protein